MKQLLMGNEAIALGAVRAGVSVVTGYPGTPSSEILETVAKRCREVYAEWSVNEKSALETAAGAAMSGARVMVTMKQVGLNVASDPLMSLNYTGIVGGMVIVAADDPGPVSSQTEQDTRRFGKFAKLAVFDPSSPEEAYLMIADAFDLSEKIKRPVLFRPTTRVCHGYASVELLPPLDVKRDTRFQRNSRFVIFPKLAYESHVVIEKTLKELSTADYPRNTLEGAGTLGIATGGVSHAYVSEALGGQLNCKLLKVSAYPFPVGVAERFLEGLTDVLVIEELDPVIEEELLLLSAEKKINVNIHGKRSGEVKNAGEFAPSEIAVIVNKFLGKDTAEATAQAPSNLPIRPPVLCAGCPHRGSFLAVKEACKGINAVFCGDIGCYTLGNAKPLDMVDTCLCMGAGITMAAGIKRADESKTTFAFVGDSTFFHTGISGIINAVYNNADEIIVILDNSATAMTGGQPHPGLGLVANGSPTAKISIENIVQAIGVQHIVKANAFDLDEAVSAVKSVLDKQGVRVIIFSGECIAVSKRRGKCVIDNDKCVNCGLCVTKLGCPALTLSGKTPTLDETLCNGCGLCAYVCGKGAIACE
ncbi:MAG: indolepyruvate ferredoxin oxidoreductase subunit alpha [Oscillospiraceae bacterium]|nr:indolepyruvate ferredoxin oxidoreductase subunit alpha [Oscillospiraceae bacterium]